MQETILKAKSLCKSFSNEGEQNHVLKNIDLEIYKGDFTVIMGSSGSGKSTLLYCLSGMDRPSAGEVYYNSKRVDNLKEKDLALFRRREIGFIFQQMHLVPNLSVFENITVPGYLLKKLPAKEIDKRAEQLLGEVGLTGLKGRLPSQLSGGQQQRAATARAMINGPQIIFADEPTGNLDSKSSNSVMKCLGKMNDENKTTILMVTHDSFAASFCKKIIFIKDGIVNMQIVRKGTRKEFFDHILDCLAVLGGERNDI